MRIFLGSQIPLGFKGVFPDFTKQIPQPDMCMTLSSSQPNIKFIRRETNFVMQSLNFCLQICQKPNNTFKIAKMVMT